jgi:hypothetical protein
MKTIITIIFIIFLGAMAQAQNNATEVKVETVEMTIVMETNYTVPTNNKTEVARLYRFKNSRVKKELSFTTKRNSAKMA